jgi:hypothetical protein
MGRLDHRHESRDMAKGAGFPTVSIVSVLAGTMVAIGTLAVLAVVVTAAGWAVSVDGNDVSTADWREWSIAATVVAGVAAFVSWFFGGYAAGRMGRRAGARHGILVFLLGAIVLIGAALLGDELARSDVLEALRREGVPTGARWWDELGIIAGLSTLAALVVGAVVGGVQGERWHARLATRYDEAMAAGQAYEDVTPPTASTREAGSLEGQGASEPRPGKRLSRREIQRQRREEAAAMVATGGGASRVDTGDTGDRTTAGTAATAGSETDPDQASGDKRDSLASGWRTLGRRSARQA